MASVWLLTSGSYSDYSVDAVFTSEAEALKVAARDDGGWDVEEFTIYAECPEPVVYYSAWVTSRASYISRHPGEVETTRHVLWPWSNMSDPDLHAAPKVVVYDDYIAVSVQRAEEELATKIAADTFAAEMIKRDLPLYPYEPGPSWSTTATHPAVVATRASE